MSGVGRYNLNWKTFQWWLSGIALVAAFAVDLGQLVSYRVPCTPEALSDDLGLASDPLEDQLALGAHWVNSLDRLFFFPFRLDRFEVQGTYSGLLDRVGLWLGESGEWRATVQGLAFEEGTGRLEQGWLDLGGQCIELKGTLNLKGQAPCAFEVNHWDRFLSAETKSAWLKFERTESDARLKLSGGFQRLRPLAALSANLPLVLKCGQIEAWFLPHAFEVAAQLGLKPNLDLNVESVWDWGSGRGWACRTRVYSDKPLDCPLVGLKGWNFQNSFVRLRPDVWLGYGLPEPGREKCLEIGGEVEVLRGQLSFSGASWSGRTFLSPEEVVVSSEAPSRAIISENSVKLKEAPGIAWSFKGFLVRTPEPSGCSLWVQGVPARLSGGVRFEGAMASGLQIYGALRGAPESGDLGPEDAAPISDYRPPFALGGLDIQASGPLDSVAVDMCLEADKSIRGRALAVQAVRIYGDLKALQLALKHKGGEDYLPLSCAPMVEEGAERGFQENFEAIRSTLGYLGFEWFSGTFKRLLIPVPLSPLESAVGWLVGLVFPRPRARLLDLVPIRESFESMDTDNVLSSGAEVRAIALDWDEAYFAQWCLKGVGGFGSTQNHMEAFCFLFEKLRLSFQLLPSPCRVMVEWGRGA